MGLVSALRPNCTPFKYKKIAQQALAIDDECDLCLALTQRVFDDNDASSYHERLLKEMLKACRGYPEKDRAKCNSCVKAKANNLVYYVVTDEKTAKKTYVLVKSCGVHGVLAYWDSCEWEKDILGTLDLAYVLLLSDAKLRCQAFLDQYRKQLFRTLNSGMEYLGTYKKLGEYGV